MPLREAAGRGIQVGGRGEHARDLDDEFSTALGQPVKVVCCFEVLPGVVGHSQPNVTLSMRIVRHPSLGPGVVQSRRSLLATVASALPREQSPCQAGLRGRRPCGVEAMPAVVELRARDLRLAKVHDP